MSDLNRTHEYEYNYEYMILKDAIDKNHKWISSRIMFERITIFNL